MGAAEYLKRCLWDFVLVALACTALGYTLLDTIYAPPAFQYSPLPALVVVALVAFLFAVVSSRRLVAPLAVAYALVVVVLCVASGVLTQGSVTEDTEGNYLFSVLLLAACATVGFLLARSRAGTVVLLAAGVFSCGWVQFFYARNELAWMLVFLVAALALVIYRNFQQTVKRASSARELSLTTGFGVSIGAVAAAVALAAGAWLVIAMLNPQAVQLKLITEYRALETQQVQGTSSEYLTPDMELTSNATTSSARTTDDLQRATDGIDTPARPKSGSSSQQRQASGSFLGIDLNSVQRAFDFQGNPLVAALLWLLVLLIPLGVIAYFVGRRVMRTRRLAKIQALGPTEQVRALYSFCLSRLRRLGFSVPVGATLTEFARNNAHAMARFDEASGASFESMTGSFAAVTYGIGEASDKQAEECASYYRAFWKAARKQLGNVKYFFKSFRL